MSKTAELAMALTGRMDLSDDAVDQHDQHARVQGAGREGIRREVLECN